jgi:CRISPR/Cas system-associated exonuclease Cas4 (RecB family)
MDGSEGKAPSGTKKHHWSYSKSVAFDVCPLKIYFLTESSGRPFNTEHRIGNPVNLNAIVGIAVHRGIASQIDKWVEGRDPTFRDAKQVAEDWIKEVWENKNERIVEAINGQSISNRQLHKFVGISKRNLRTFFKAIWPQFRSHEYVLHEDQRMFEIQGNPVHVKVDFCTRNRDGDLVITDWKTKKPPLLTVDSLQLNTYGLWARECVEPDIGKIRLQLAHTRTGDTAAYSIGQKEMDEIESQIIHECNEWNEMDDIESFSPKPDAKKCLECKFLSKCDTGQSTVDF